MICPHCQGTGQDPSLSLVASVSFACPTESEINGSHTRRGSMKRHKMQKELTQGALAHASCRADFPPTRPVVAVRLLRAATRRLDSDNLQGSLKYCRDEVARWLGTDDGPTSGLEWFYGEIPLGDVVPSRPGFVTLQRVYVELYVRPSGAGGARETLHLNLDPFYARAPARAPRAKAPNVRRGA